MDSDQTGGQKDEGLQEFLDENQYTRDGILRYELIFGRSFVSTGGLETTQQFCKSLNLKSDELVLDVGCGIGGSAFHMAKTYGAKVHGVDLSANMISIALERQQEEMQSNKVSFEISDISKQNYPDHSYDVIYSRDTLLHIKEKEDLFAKFFKWLKPGGRLLITDYCQGDQEHSQEFREYVTQRCYNLLTVKQYGDLLEKVGFINVRPEDRTDQFVDILQREIANFEKIRATVLENFSSHDMEYLLDGWAAKVRRCGAGDQAWGLFTAQKL